MAQASVVFIWLPMALYDVPLCPIAPHAPYDSLWSQRLHMSPYRYIGSWVLNMASNCSLWFPMASYGSQRLHMPPMYPYSYIWLPIAFYANLWLPVTFFCFLWLPFAPYGYDFIWLPSAHLGTIWHPLALYHWQNLAQLGKTWCNLMQKDKCCPCSLQCCFLSKYIVKWSWEMIGSLSPVIYVIWKSTPLVEQIESLIPMNFISFDRYMIGKSNYKLLRQISLSVDVNV
jgi:hypothetical protein